MRQYLRVGSRPSQLALRQVEEIAGFFPNLKFEIITIETKGDKDKTTPLVFKEGSNFFTDEIHQALLKGEIDLAVHSAKDLEQDIPQGLTIAARTKSISPFDCLVSRNKKKISELAQRSIIGTSSRKRKEAILSFRPDLLTCDIRGNIEQRLAQLDQGKFDAVIIAEAALIRLGLSFRITEVLPASKFKPHPLQGRLAIEINQASKDLLKIFRRIDVN